MKYWTQKEEKYLKDNYRNKTLKEIASHLNRSYGSVKGKLDNLDIPSKFPNWTKKEDELLRKEYNNNNAQEISNKLGRSKRAVGARAIKLGLTQKQANYKWWIRDKNHKCNKCGKIKPVSCFSKYWRYKERRRPTCKECVRAYSKKRQNRNYELIKELKDKLCDRCSKKFPTCVMDFHHKEGKEKERVIKASLSKEKILEEAKKCKVVCANCHRIIHNLEEPSREVE